jgi:hypothetical protein
MITLLNAWSALWYRVVHGYWCAHPRFSPWRIEDMGRYKARSCPDCGRWESTW